MTKKAKPPEIKRTDEQSKVALRRKVKIFYDLQRIRTQVAGRTYKRAEGTEIELHEVDIAILETRAKELETAEKHALKDVADHLKTIPFYKDVLSDKTIYKGIGPTMAGVILSSFDVRDRKYVSQWWSFAGLSPVPSKRCKKCHRIVVDNKHVADAARRKTMDGAPKSPAPVKCEWAEPLSEGQQYDSGKAMKPTKGEKLPYNSWLRSKLCGVLGEVLIKLNSPWRKYYDDYKHRKASIGWGRSDMHRHRAAIRYMIKMLLLDIWNRWREHAGLPATPSYHEGKLGHVHGQTVHENQTAKASQEKQENRHAEASHMTNENQRNRAGQLSNANQDEQASRFTSENHTEDANQDEIAAELAQWNE